MNTYFKIAFGLSLITIVILISIILKDNTEAATAVVVPGSIDDPVVTKGYVDQQIQSLTNQGVTKSYVDQQITGVKSTSVTKTYVDSQITTIQNDVKTNLATKSYLDQQLSTALSTMVTKDYVTQQITQQLQSVAVGKVVTVPVGKKLIVGQGTELIVRAGKAVVYSTSKNGLSDLTVGTTLAPGAAVALDHLVLSPTTNRGLKAAPTMKTGNIIVFVRGSYKVQ